MPENVVDFEIQMASNLLTNEQNRDANLRYNPKKVTELPAVSKNINLQKYLSDAGVKTDQVIIGEMKYYQNLDQFLSQKNIPLIKDYLKYHIINGNASSLDENLDNIRFDFYSKYLQGQKEQRAMDKRGLSMVNGVLGEAFGKLYVDEYFTPESKQQMEIYIDYLLKSFKKHISEIDWMSPQTKEKAQEKLSKFTVKIAYPDQWKDYSKLKVEAPAQGASLYSNLKNVSLWQYEKNLDKVMLNCDSNM